MEDDNEREDGAEDDFYEDMDPSYFTHSRPIEAFVRLNGSKVSVFLKMTLKAEVLFFDENGMESKSFDDFKSIFFFYNDGPFNPTGCSDSLIRFLAGDDYRL